MSSGFSKSLKISFQPFRSLEIKLILKERTVNIAQYKMILELTKRTQVHMPPQVIVKTIQKAMINFQVISKTEYTSKLKKWSRTLNSSLPNQKLPFLNLAQCIVLTPSSLF